MKGNEYAIFESMLSSADIKINGSRPWDIQVNDVAMFDRILADGSLGLGESYMEKMWECNDIAELVNRILAFELDKHLDLRTKMILGAKIGKDKIKKFFKPFKARQFPSTTSHFITISVTTYTALCSINV